MAPPFRAGAGILMRALALATVGIAMLLTAPPAVAVHGQAYHAFGTAVAADGTVYSAQIDWGGYREQWFTATIRTLSGELVSTERFPGYGPGAGWSAFGPVTCPVEALWYHAWNDAVNFDIRGLQVQSPCAPGPAAMVYVGTYRAYEVQLFVEPLGVHQ